MKRNKFHDLKGERKDQLLVVVDQNGKKIGTDTRENCHKGVGRPHLAFLALIRDAENRLILTQRSKIKSLWGGYWDASVVSHVLAGETPENAARRRCGEELGIEIDFRDLGAFYYTAHFVQDAENEYCHFLIGDQKGEIFPNPVEFSATRKITFIDLKKEIRKNPECFTPWLKLAIEKIDIAKHVK